MGLDQLKWLQHLPNQLGSYNPCMASCTALSWYPSILLLFFIFTGASLVYDLFFKPVTRRVTNSYQIDRDGFFSSYSSATFDRAAKITSDKNTVNTIDTIELTEDVESRITSTNYDLMHNSSPSVQIITNYRVIISFNSGASSTIESNGLAVWHDDNDQVAFRELIAETKMIVEQIKNFLDPSKNEITPSSN